jgi:hypothetical protein
MKSRSERLFGHSSNFRRFFVVSLISVALFASGTAALAADVYVSLTGTRTSGKSTAGDWTNANCYNNIRAAMTAASASDTITINDGTYTGSSNLIDQNNLPKSGTSSAYTIIKARNIPCQNGAACGQPLKVILDSQGNPTGGAGLYTNNPVNSSYVKIQGIFFKGIAMIWGTSHWYIKQCAVQGDQDGNNAAFTAMTTTYTVVEDTVSYGKGRYKFLFYDQTRSGTNTNSVCRRCIARMDYMDDTNPVADFSLYYQHNMALLNCISIDGNLPSYWHNVTELDGSFQQAVDQSSNIGYSIKGSIAINNAMPVGFSEHGGAGGISFADVAGINVPAGIYANAASQRLTMANVNSHLFSGWFANPIIMDVGVTQYNGSPTLNNSLVVNVPYGKAVGSGFSGDYLNYFGTTGTSWTPTHVITTDPRTNGLLYPIRIEAGSTLKTAGSGGGQIGADITQILGVDGAEYGSANVDTPQGNLWPWPLENWIKAQMASMDTTISGSAMPSPTRGFASSTAKRLDGVNPVTLTSYIWESLGNPIPASLYSTAPAVSSPTVTVKSTSPL